jgi:hypothetical protein
VSHDHPQPQDRPQQGRCRVRGFSHPEGIEGCGCVYAIETSHITPTIIKVGSTVTPNQRFNHHRSSFAGYDHVVAFHVLDIVIYQSAETWLKQYLSDWSFGGSPEQFVVPNYERYFLSLIPSVFFIFQGHLNLRPEDIRDLPILDKLNRIYDASWWPVEGYKFNCERSPFEDQKELTFALKNPPARYCVLPAKGGVA